MNRVARDPDRLVEIFTETANRRGISPVIVEKDFWVCWTLGQVFENPEDSPSFLFKLKRGVDALMYHERKKSRSVSASSQLPILNYSTSRYGK